ncbi:hypothetical protein E1267_24885 [Nonomuraea longispora]|uniref:6-phosphogluconate dehydrogenase NADP-binding domain-containing protein n=1 Tax=Nonomuraea longispora TaxID=1848320 RepID=A0A4V2XJT3_9ACTN|nr:hypothetical protein [Nonomuraea longispora]TDC03846.1 hypothetical protein E1267_24885 [Nonomuraea longispora]
MTEHEAPRVTVLGLGRMGTTIAGADHLAGAMMALPHTIGAPEAFFFSGSESAFEEHRTALEVMASGHYLGARPRRRDAQPGRARHRLRRPHRIPARRRPAGDV